MIYKPKTLFTGYKIGLKNDKSYLGIPDKYFNGEEAIMEFNGEKYRLFKKDAVKVSEPFKDKFQIGKTYCLYYFLAKE